MKLWTALIFSALATLALTSAKSYAGSGWLCSAVDADDKTYSIKTVDDPKAIEKAVAKCRQESSRPKTCKEVWPCIRIFGS
jgi:hypothetical protein